MNILVGTMMGHLFLFKIEERTIHLYRSVVNAHFEAITCISPCPLNNNEECLFATGSYDGTLKIWSINEQKPIY